MGCLEKRPRAYGFLREKSHFGCFLFNFFGDLRVQVKRKKKDKGRGERKEEEES